MAKHKPTIKDIAKACDVSLSTVSLVLNDSPRISEDTRRKVLAAVKQYGYVRNVHAQGLVSRSSRVLSVAVPDLSHVFADIYFGEIVSGIYDHASEQGYKMLLDIAGENFIETREYLNILQTRRADGMLFIASSVNDVYLRDLEREDYPFLLVNHYFPDSSLNFLSVDYRACAEKAAEHLLQLGHRAIGLIAGSNTHTGKDFREAFLARCLKAGCKEQDVPWEDSEWNQEGGFEAARRLLARNPALTAIMGTNDRMAIGAMRYLHTHTARIPKRISVMGMDDIKAARFTTPGLTTIRLDLYDIGRQACERLLDIVRGKRTSCREFIQASLVERESTAPAPR
jgi:LacI family transcriptional regulator